MARKHLFPLVVILAAAVFAGLLAISHTRALDKPAAAATTSDPAISFRLQKLDRFERSLRQQLANAPDTRASATIYRASPASSPIAPRLHESEPGDVAEYEDGGRDD